MGPCFRTIGCTHLENRLEYRYLDDPRFWERLHVGPSATVEKTRVFYTCRPPIKRCVHALVRTQGPIATGVRGYGQIVYRRSQNETARRMGPLRSQGRRRIITVL